MNGQRRQAGKPNQFQHLTPRTAGNLRLRVPQVLEVTFTGLRSSRSLSAGLMFMFGEGGQHGASAIQLCERAEVTRAAGPPVEKKTGVAGMKSRPLGPAML